MCFLEYRADSMCLENFVWIYDHASLDVKDFVDF